MIKKKFEIGMLILATLLVSIALIPAVSAQEEKDYSVTAEEAFKHANAHMINFIEADTDFEEWKGAYIEPKPLELYDINGQKLYYQFSVYKNNETIGKIDVCADKTLGQSVKAFEFNPKPFNTDEAMKKSIEITKKYPTGNIKSTEMVVYSYPKIGAMTIVKGKTTEDEHRIIVDAYTLDVVEDKPATETEPGVWSMYELVSKNGLDENLKDWQESERLTEFIEQEANNKGINISLPITEEQMTKLSGNEAITSTITSKNLNVPLYGQETDYYCGPTSAQMIASYYGVSHTQNYIYGVMGGIAPNGTTNTQQLTYYKASNGLAKTGSIPVTTGLTFSSVVSEINNNRPFKSGVTGHARVCKGYSYDIYGGQYLKINDPWPVGSGTYKVEGPGQEINRIYVRS